MSTYISCQIYTQYEYLVIYLCNIYLVILTSALVIQSGSNKRNIKKLYIFMAINENMIIIFLKKSNKCSHFIENNLRIKK